MTQCRTKWNVSYFPYSSHVSQESSLQSMIWFNCTHLQHQQAAISSQHALIHTNGVRFTTHLENEGKPTNRPTVPLQRFPTGLPALIIRFFASGKIFRFHVSLRNMARINYRNMNFIHANLFKGRNDLSWTCSKALMKEVKRSKKHFLIRKKKPFYWKTN